MILAFVMGCGIIALHLAYAWQGHSHYRDQHLGTALVYAREGIDLLRPVIVGFNANGNPTPLELPVWQAAASLPMRWFGGWFGWANIVSLLLFASVCFPVYRLGKQSGSCATGWWCLALLLCQPLVWLQAGRAGTDGTSIAAAIWFFYCGCKAITGPRRFWWTVAAAATGALAATLKLPFMMTSGIALGVVLVSSHRREPGAWLASVFAGVFSAGVFLLWTRYTDSCLAQAEFPYVDLRLSHNPEMVRWYFGDWSYRFDAANWVRGGWRMLNSLFGSFALAALPLAALGLKRAEIQSKALLAGAVLTTAIFTHLVLHHSNYYLIYSLPVALLGAPVAELAYRRLREVWRWPAFLLPLTIVGTALLGVTQGLVGMEAVAMDPYRAEVAQKLRSHTDPDDRLLIVGGGWGGDYLFLSDRAGLSIWSDNWLADAPRLNRLRELGYTKLVMVSESPLLAARQMTNPGGESYRRKTHSANGNPFSAAWPEVYSDEDILIREIPGTGKTEVVP